MTEIAAYDEALLNILKQNILGVLVGNLGIKNASISVAAVCKFAEMSDTEIDIVIEKLRQDSQGMRTVQVLNEEEELVSRKVVFCKHEGDVDVIVPYSEVRRAEISLLYVKLVELES